MSRFLFQKTTVGIAQLLAKTVATAAVLHRSKVPIIIKSFNKFYLNHIFKTIWILKQFHIWEKSTLLKFQTYKAFKALVCLNTVSYLHQWDVFTGIKINTGEKLRKPWKYVIKMNPSSNQLVAYALFSGLFGHDMK